MKKNLLVIYYAIFCLALFSLFSCSKDSNPVTDTTKKDSVITDPIISESFSASISGEVSKYFNCPSLFVEYFSPKMSPSYHRISGTTIDAASKTTLYISINDKVTGPTEINLVDDYKSLDFIAYLNITSKLVETGYQSVSGKIKITEFKPTYIKGTFSGKLKEPGTSRTLDISDGIFTVKRN
jgi:hypothetical protein